jgi:hypothetical protein
MTRAVHGAKRRYNGNHYLNRAEDASLRLHRRECEQNSTASQILRERMESVIFKFGFRHGITTEEARHLLLNTGVRL